MEVIKQPLTIEQFRNSLALIKDGDMQEFYRVQYLYTMDIWQLNILAEAHEFNLKSIQ